MSKLKGVAPKAATPSKPKILIFGKPGVGKTWASLDFPSVYYIDTEGGANGDHYTDRLEASGGLYFGPEHGGREFQAVTDEVKALGSEQHPHRTIVIDSISELYLAEIAKEANRLEQSGKKDEYGASKKPAVAATRELVRWLKKIDMTAILIAHQKELREGGEVVGVTFDAWEKLEYLFDLSLNIYKIGNSRKARVVKSRLIGFPDGAVFDWSYDEFASRYGKAVIERQSEALQLATEDQLAELKNLLEVIRLPETTRQKWFDQADVSDWPDMTSAQIAGCLDNLRARTTPTNRKENAA